MKLFGDVSEAIETGLLTLIYGWMLVATLAGWIFWILSERLGRRRRFPHHAIKNAEPNGSMKTPYR